MKKLLLILLIIFPSIAFAEDNIDSLFQILDEKVSLQTKHDEIEKRLLDSLTREFKHLSNQSQFHIRTNEQTINSISTQLNSASYSLTIFAILFGMAGIYLGVYVTNVEKRVINLNEQSKSQLRQSIEIKKEVLGLNELIKNNIKGLYEKIRREETIHLLKRLCKIPDDISNISILLLSRDLEREDFLLLKEAYMKLKEDLRPKQKEGIVLIKDYSNKYLLQFFQHFIDLAIKDPDIGPDLTSFYVEGIICSFKSDLINSAQGFIKAIIDLGLQSKKTDINNFLNGLSSRDNDQLAKIYKIFFDALKTRDDRFEFYNLISSNLSSLKYKIRFGELLNNEYSEADLSETEKIYMTEIHNLKSRLKT